MTFSKQYFFFQKGELCGLLPKWSEPTSDQLHFVVELSSGIRDKTGPVERLKEALSSKIAFQKYYLVSFFIVVYISIIKYHF